MRYQLRPLYCNEPSAAYADPLDMLIAPLTPFGKNPPGVALA